jgi:hypothetical protein
METFLERLASPAIIVPVCAFLIGGIAIIVNCVQSSLRSQARARVEEAQLQLKRELVAQGRSAEDIERILKSGQHETTDG